MCAGMKLGGWSDLDFRASGPGLRPWAAPVFFVSALRQLKGGFFTLPHRGFLLIALRGPAARCHEFALGWGCMLKG